MKHVSLSNCYASNLIHKDVYIHERFLDGVDFVKPGSFIVEPNLIEISLTREPFHT